MCVPILLVSFSICIQTPESKNTDFVHLSVFRQVCCWKMFIQRKIEEYEAGVAAQSTNVNYSS